MIRGDNQPRDEYGMTQTDWAVKHGEDAIHHYYQDKTKSFLNRITKLEEALNKVEKYLKEEFRMKVSPAVKDYETMELDMGSWIVPKYFIEIQETVKKALADDDLKDSK